MRISLSVFNTRICITLTAISLLFSCTSADPSAVDATKKVNSNSDKYKDLVVDDRLQPYVDSIAAFDAIFDQAVGYGGNQPTVYGWFEKLMLLADDNELVRLTNHRSPAVRGYSFWALVEREHPKVKEIMLQHVDDTVFIGRMSGCMGYQEKLNEFMFSIVEGGCLNADCSKLPPDDLAEIKAKMK